MLQKAMKPILWISISAMILGIIVPPLLLGENYHCPFALWEQVLYYFAAVYILCIIVWRIATLIREKKQAKRHDEEESRP